MRNFLLTLVSWILLTISLLPAQTNPIPQNPWGFVKDLDARAESGKRQIVPQHYATARMDVAAMKTLLDEAPLWFTREAESKMVELTLPTPDRRFERFKIQYAPVMAPELARKYPMIRSYAGIGIDDPTAYLRFDMTPEGFHAIVFSAENGTILIDPYSSEDNENYVVYFEKDIASTTSWQCFTKSVDDSPHIDVNTQPRLAGDCTMRTYELALACTGEYSIARCGPNPTTPLVLAAMQTTLMHINAIYEKELSIHLNLVAAVIYLDPTTDPFLNFNKDSLPDQNQVVCNDEVGAFMNYDIGHVFSTYPGGGAKKGVVCNSSSKAKGFSGWPSPVGIQFDWLCSHEMAHQFGADHTFNYTNNCQPYWNPPTAFEPGGGSTIMGYAGINCVPKIQDYSDLYFHAGSLDQIGDYTSSFGQCDEELPTSNDAPTADAGNDYWIPKSTPFLLTGVGADDNDDQLTYCWEQMDNDLAPMPPYSTFSGGPAFRSFAPTFDSMRFFPTMDSILRNDNVAKWEVLPSVTRSLNFRLTVRDNRVYGGCTGEDDMIVNITSIAGPFIVTSPNTAVSWQALSQQTVTWNVANTNAIPVLCPNVDILLSVDGGLSFPFTLATATPNDGSQAITLPNNQTSTARIMVRGSGNIFFDVSNANFNITAPSASGTPDIQWQNTIGGSDGDGLNSIQQTSDGGYILGGFSYSNISGDKTENNLGNADYWVIKLDASGNISWQNTIGGNSADEVSIIEQTNDGGYILGGSSASNISSDKTENCQGNYDYWVIKLDASGNISWQNTIGGNSFDVLSSIHQTSDGGYILGGTSDSNISGDKTENNLGGLDYWVVKLDASGNIAWQNTIGGNDYEFLEAIEQTNDGGYILGGSSPSNISGDKTENSQGQGDYWIVKLDATGNITWQNTIGGNNQDDIRSIHQTSDGGYILGGTSDSNISGDKTTDIVGGCQYSECNDYWVLKLDASGNISWQNTINGYKGDILIATQQTSDGGYILGGWTGFKFFYQGVMDLDYFAVKLDASGNISWTKTIGGDNDDFLWSIEQTSEGGYILGGSSYSSISGDKAENSQGDGDYWVVKLSSGCPMMSLNFTLIKPSCFGSFNGSVQVNPPSPISGYSYIWSNGATTQTISNVKTGAYTVTVTKTSTGCTAVGTAVLEDTSKLEFDPFLLTHPNCYVSNSGSITAKAKGGQGALTYSWSTGATGATVNNLTSGTYMLTVVDAKGCSITGITALSNFGLTIESVTVVPTGNKWKATVNASGGALPYKYRKRLTGGSWSNWNGSKVFPNLVAGQYTFEVCNNNNQCVASLTMQVPPPQFQYPNSESRNVLYPPTLNIFPNPTTGVLQLESDISINSVIVTDLLGRTIKLVTGDVREIDMTLLPVGLYVLEVRFAGSAKNEILRVMKN